MTDLGHYDDGRQLRMNDPFLEEIRAKIHDVIWPTSGGQQMSVDITKMLFTDYTIKPKVKDDAGHLMVPYKGEEVCNYCGFQLGCDCPGCQEKGNKCPGKAN